MPDTPVIMNIDLAGVVSPVLKVYPLIDTGGDYLVLNNSESGDAIVDRAGNVQKQAIVSESLTGWFYVEVEASGVTIASGYVSMADTTDPYYVVEDYPVSSNDGLTQQDVRDAVGLASANLDTQLSSLTTQSEIVARVEFACKPQGGNAQLSVWLERDNNPVNVVALDASATCSVTLREHGSGINLFTKAGAVSDLENNVFELEQESPGFNNGVMYEIEGSVTADGKTYKSKQMRYVI